ncbi:hypothetical protein [Candidatus Odyssella thessalonicensis]|uniref:hypothetical protein n=1 Tax=Candidatus Odyssella thessalonicensis TaxID=84647 RepID=UPI0002F48969|nr:hypothetical protein [Candidatus Odyssella thessalonicensis]
MTPNNLPPHRPSLFQEIVGLLKDHPQAAKWLKFIGGSYLIIQVLTLFFGAAILYTVWNAFHENKSRFDNHLAELNQLVNDPEKKSAFEDFVERFDRSVEEIDRWNTTKESRPPISPPHQLTLGDSLVKDLHSSPDAEDNEPEPVINR